jgi:hypothetical protein
MLTLLVITCTFLTYHLMMAYMGRPKHVVSGIIKNFCDGKTYSLLFNSYFKLHTHN